MKIIKNKILISFFFLAFLVQGCATYPTDPAEQAQYWAKKASSSVLFGNSSDLWDAVHSGSKVAGSGDVIRAIFNNPKAENLYKKEAFLRYERYRGLESALFLRNQVYEIWLSGVLPEETGRSILEDMDKQIIQKHKSGEYIITLTNNISAINGLDNDADKLIILNNSINSLKDQTGARTGLVKALMERAVKAGEKSSDYGLIKSNLASMNIKKTELIYVAPVFSEFAKKREAEVSLNAYLSLKNGDAFLREDLIKALKSKVKGVTWVEESGPSIVTVEIEKVRHDEIDRPPYTETVTYSQGQVNFFAGALLMPNNASYLFDMSKSESMIEYGYIVRAAGNKEILIRGQEKGTSVNCINARIQNVFGGVSPADFVANSDMQNKCSRSGNKNIQTLRSTVYAKVASSVLQIPEIKQVHDSN